MSCERYLDLISARLDGELSPGEQAELDAHLQACPACRVIANDMQGLHSALTGLGEVDAPAELSQTVLSKIKAEKQQNRRRFVRRLSALAACLVLCVGVLRVADATYSEHTRRNKADPNLPSVARHMPAAMSEELSFTNQRRLRLSAMSTSFAPTADLLGNAETLSRFITRFPYDDFSAVAQTYDEEYFRTHRLLAVVIFEPSSSITHTISRLTEASVTILRDVPEAGDSDIAPWLILAEVGGTGPETPLSVELLDN